MAKIAEPGVVQDLMEQLSKLSTVTETYVLPTKGKLDNLPSESVQLRMMTTYEEKLRTGSRGTSFWKTMASIINRCIVEPKGIDAYKLTVADFIFLMYKLRIVSYGKDYKVNITTCPLCNKPISNVVLDLDKLDCTYIDDLDEPLEEPIEIKLPVTKWNVKCRLLRMNEYDALQKEGDKLLEDFPEYEGDPLIALRLARQIISINDNQIDPAQLRALVEKLPAADENVIVSKLDKLELGLNLVSEYRCPRCGQTFKVPLSMSDEFFRPTSD